MSGKLQHSISELLKESSQFNTNDVLVHAHSGHSKLFFCSDELEFDFQDFPSTILREADKTRKESGVNSLCLARGIVELSLNGKKVQTPILLIPLEYRRDKIKQRVSFEALDDEGFVNPFLLMHLEHALEIRLFDYSTIQPFDSEGLQDITSTLSNAGLTVQDESNQIIGNFHHHRYQIIKELEELLELDDFAPNLNTIFGFDVPQTGETLTLPPNNLFAADTDHEKVFEQAAGNNLVIQGPPGTGKSQVLTNVVGKLLGTDNTTVVISEKRVALEVINKKLSKFGLDKMCFIATSDHLSHTFLQELKTTWDYFESYEIKPVNNLRLSEQYEANLQMTLDLLSQKDLIGGVSFHRFQELREGKHLETYNYVSQVSTIDAFITNRSTLEKVYKKGVHSSVGRLKTKTISSDDFILLDRKIEAWISSLQQLSKLFDFSSWNDFKIIMKEAAHCQIYENDLYKKYAAIFRPNSRAQQRFLSLRKKYMKARLEIEQINSNQSHWKIIPSETETNVLLEKFEKGGFFCRLKLNKRWKEISHLPVTEAKKELAKHLEETAKINSFSHIIIKFCELGVEDVENEVPLIHQTLRVFSEDRWKALERIPAERRLSMTMHHATLHNLHHDINSFFNIDDDLIVLSFLKTLKLNLAEIISMKEALLSLDKNALLSLARNESLEDYEGELLNSHWVRFKEHFPAFAKFKMNAIQEKINAVISAQDSEAKLFAQEIENRLHNSFVAYHEILNTPARKLSDEQKQLKARLRKGKSILVKEFSKTRSHPSLRELYNSEAREWIQLLKPIWLSNPTQLAKCFPLEKNLFDVAIFDEASQIPLQNALGTIQRSKRILVAGDEHQMGPAAYFKSGKSEVMDLLHQSNYHWQKVKLQHHYRSAHPDLIAFSNKYFYGGQLMTYPANITGTPIRNHFIKNGRFVDRKNAQEAKSIADSIETILAEEASIGIVAFSEEQLNCIWTELSEKSQQQLTDKLENNQGFFKALENVQGDECDHLFISFGYARNEDGDFHMRFGPLNTANGRKRLNVLLTRAIKTIDFFSSVRSTDFKLSENESINLVRQWIAFAENYKDASELSFPFGMQPIRNENQLTFNKIQEALPNAREVVTLDRVLRSRGWKVAYS